MRSAIVIVPSAPALLPGNVGRVDPLAVQRESALQALTDGATFAQSDDAGLLVHLVVASDRAPRHTGVALGERVGRHLLECAGITVTDCLVVPWDASPVACRNLGADRIKTVTDEHANPGMAARAEAGRLTVVVADGCARRSPKAPGHFDERALAFDEEMVSAIRSASAQDILALDATLAADLLAQGRAPLQVMAGMWDKHAAYRCERLEVSDPFGVLYLVGLLSSKE